VAGASLLNLLPAAKQDTDFVDLIYLMIRDASGFVEDKWFPESRNFDWFEFHSWSHGVQPMPEGKDQESTSEDVNMMYGLILWGREMNDTGCTKRGELMLSANVQAIGRYFILRTGNTNHHPDFVKNHVTGIFFQSEVKYTTWFGNNLEFIHGIQMLPLTPALQLIRAPEFSREEWDDVLNVLPESRNPNSGWSSILLTGGYAMFEPEKAWCNVTKQLVVDDGLTRSYMLYWAASQMKEGMTIDCNPGKRLGMPPAVFIVAIIVFISVMVAGFFFAPKGEPTEMAEPMEVGGQN